MALELHVRYPAQVLPGGADYPFGKARNVTVPGDGTGTPFEADLVNDWLGFFQGLLLQTGTNPSFTPDTAIASQYIDALRNIATHPSTDLFAPGVHADSLTIASGTFIGESSPGVGLNLFTGISRFIGPAQFDDGVNTNEISLDLPGAVFTTTGTLLGNGFLGVDFQIDINCSSTVHAHDEIVLVDGGRVRQHVAYAPDSNHTFTLAEGRVIVVRTGIVTATRIYKLPDEADGAQIELINHSAFTMTIQSAGGGSIGTLAAISGIVPGYMKCSWHDDGVAPRWQMMFKLP